MTDSTQPYDDLGYELMAEDPSANTPRAALRMLKRKLRGRWLLLLLLAPCLGTICVVLGYNAVAPQYRSSGVIRFVRQQPSILYDERDEQQPADFAAFVATQPKFLTSTKVLEAAVGQLQISDVNWPLGFAGVAKLKQALDVHHHRGDQYITVSVINNDPLVARKAVDAILISYRHLCPVPQSFSRDDRIAALAQREQTLETALRDSRTRLLDMTDQFGVETIEDLHQTRVDELLEVNVQIADLEDALAGLAPADLDDAPDPLGRLGIDSFHVMEIDAPPAMTATPLMSDEAIALRVEMMAWEQKYGPAHPRIRAIHEELELLQLQAAMRRDTLDLDRGTSAELIGPAVSADELRFMWKDAVARREALREQAADLGCQRIELATVQDRIGTLEKQLTDTRQRLDHTRVEASASRDGMLNIAAYGDTPVAPESDRRLALAAISALFGIAATICMIAGIGVVDPRCRYAEELQDVTTELPLLALLPDLASRHKNRESLAAHAIHQLRNFLETHNAEQLRGVYAVTSVDRGEGRTSVTLALGASFAAAGCRTLLIDADVSQCHLTRELDLVGKPGLCESIGQADGSGRMYKARSENLWALPVGATSQFNPHDLSFTALKRLVESVRPQFDAVVIDTGPVTSSLEGGLAAAVCDQVLLLVSRFQSRRLISTALQELRQLGANCIGFVFNRAPRSDFRRLPVLKTQSSRSVASLVQSDLLNAGQRDDRAFGRSDAAPRRQAA